MQCTPNIKGAIIWLFKWIVWVGFHVCVCSLFQIILDYNVGSKWEGDPFTHHSIFLILMGNPLLWWVIHPTF